MSERLFSNVFTFYSYASLSVSLLCKIVNNKDVKEFP